MTQQPAATLALRVLAVGDVHAADDLALVERAVARVTVRHPGLELVVAGAAGRAQLLEQMQRAHVFVAARPQAAPHHVPPAVPVAMAGGLCVIASAVGGIEGLITDGFDGLLVPAGDEDALVEALARVAGHPRERRRLGEAAATSIRGALRSA